MDSLHPMTIAFVAVLVGGTLAAAPGAGDGSSWTRWLRPLGAIVKWAFFVLVALALIFTIVGIPILVAFVVVINMALVRRRAGQQYALLLTIAAAAEHGMPLAPTLDAFARENRGSLGRRAQRAAQLLRAGCPLPQALEQVGGLVPRDALATIRVGAEAGTLAPAVREATESLQLFEPVWSSLSGKLAYFCFVLTMMTGIVSFMFLKISPAFEKIFEDFGVELPGITQAVFALSGSFSVAGVLFLLLGMGMSVLLLYALVRLVGLSAFELPGTGPLVRRFHTAPILQALALAVDRGLPFRGAIATLAGAYPRRSIRWRLHSVVMDLDGGADWAESLARHGLIRQADRAVLQAAERVGNLSWALREVAASSRRRLIYRLQGLLNVLFVVVIVGFGFLVLALVASYFTPLVKLIRNLT